MGEYSLSLPELFDTLPRAGDIMTTEAAFPEEPVP
jgi:hypothetical protein